MKKKEHSPSIGEVVDYFLESYDFPKREDIAALTNRLAGLESLLKEILTGTKGGKPAPARAPARRKVAGKPAAGKTAEIKTEKRARRGRRSLSATDEVLQVLKKNGGSVSFKEILEKTNFDDKKVRNIVFRLNKLGRIVREDRGTYRIPG